MTYLLDVNLLVALIDPAHVGHDAAHAWFASEGSGSWATCPITENGVIRVAGHPKYPNTPGSPAAVMPILMHLRTLPGHEFWSDDVSLAACETVDSTRITTPAQVTDTYLLALAVRRRGKLATLDRRLLTHSVRGGKAALRIIG